MAIRTPRNNNNLETLRRDLICGGYAISAIEQIPGAHGRTADLYLANGVVVKWDDFSQTIWAEGRPANREKVEGYLRSLYESAWRPRWLTMTMSRMLTVRQNMNRVAARWLLQSNSLGARVIRRQIESGPNVFFRYRKQPSATRVA